VTRLEGIRQKVFMDRYSLKDPAGQALEHAPEDLWARVARGISEAEKTPEARIQWEKQFYSALTNFQFVPGGRILAGAGSGHQVTYYNCMPPDQEVLTAAGYRPISEIKIGDQVVTHRNRLRPVLHKFERATAEQLYIIRSKKIGFDELRVTGEHKVYIIRSEWVNKHKSQEDLRLQQEPAWIPAKDIQAGDYVAVAHNSEEGEPATLALQDYLPGYEVEDGKLFKRTPLGNHEYVSDEGTHFKIQDQLVLDEDLCYLLGRWLGDGCVTHRTGTDIPSGIKIVFSLEEQQEAVEIARVVATKFGLDSSIKLSSTERWYDLWVDSLPVGQFFQAFLGSHSHNKKLPEQLMHLPTEATLALLRGLFSADGYISGNKLGIVLANRVLTVQIHQLLLRLGFLFSVSENTHRLGKVPAYHVDATANECAPLFERFFGVQAPEHNIALKCYFEHDNLKWVRIDEIAVEDYIGEVLDIEVEEDHSFISAGVVVSNCFVIPSPEDSRQGILDNLKIMTEIMARGGGVGINLSTLRPRGSYIRTVNGTASGPCSWAQLYSVATGDVIQQGGSRRGALMIMLDDDHPDIEEFITVKRTAGKIEHANLSVCISDRFMQAVKDDAEWDLIWQEKVEKTIRARKLWDLICMSAWESAEPGMVFMDRCNKASNTWYYEDIRCVNPCGEQPLPPWGVCNLGALNLAAFVEDGVLDYAKLADQTRVAMRFLDNVIDSTEYFIKENEEAQLGTRRTGLGTMGLADALIKMQIAYGSDESVPVIERIYTTIRNAAYEASADNAAEKGVFPRFERDKYLQGQFIQQLPATVQEKIKKQGIRNAVLLTQAPTGTTSLLAGVSSGIEPVYDFAMIRRDRTGEHILYHPLLEAWREEHPNDTTPHYFVSSKDLTPEEHVRVQATIQKYTDASISKTVNAPNDHTVDQVQNLYRLAYEMGCKGITYYRDGSRDAVLTRVEDEKKQADQQAKKPSEIMLEPVVSIQQGIKPRPDLVRGYTRQVNAPEGKINVTINSDNHGPLEVFVNVGKAGSDIAALAEALGRLISLNLRVLSPLSQVDRAKEIAEQLRGIGGSRSVGFGMQQVRSLPDAVARALELHMTSLHAEAEPQSASTNDGHKNGKGTPKEENAEQPIALNRLSVTGNLCPECGCTTMVYEEGCKKCYSCGYSEC
jgi:ribonucleoside-diphosphate reductase alpha chain